MPVNQTKVRTTPKPLPKRTDPIGSSSSVAIPRAFSGRARSSERRRFISDILSSEDVPFKTELTAAETCNRTVLHISCQVLNTPHIPFIGQAIIRRLGLEFVTVGGPEQCCGAYHHYAGDHDFERHIATTSLNGLIQKGVQSVISFCPSCDDSFGRHNTSSLQQLNILQFLVDHLPTLAPQLRPLRRKVIVHEHSNDERRRRDTKNLRQLLQAIPGLEILDATKANGLGPSCQSFRPMPLSDTTTMFLEASKAEADYLIVPYHSCYRQHCKMQLLYSVEVHHYLGVIAMSLGIPYEETFKELRLLDNVDKAVERLQNRGQELGFRQEAIRSYLRQVVYS